MVINNNTKIEILEKKNSTTKLKIDGIVYYAKKDPNFYEVICSEIAKVCGLKCFSYEPIVINNEIRDCLGEHFFTNNTLPTENVNYVFSKDISYEGDFISFVDFFEDRRHTCSLYDIWNVLEQKIPDKCSNIMNQVILMYIFDFLIMNSDREALNYGILNNEYLVILDNQASFTEWVQTIAPEDSSIFSDNMSEDIEEFLSISSNETLKLFEEILVRLKPEVFNKVLNNIERCNLINIPNKRSIQAKYRINYYKIYKILEKIKEKQHISKR